MDLLSYAHKLIFLKCKEWSVTNNTHFLELESMFFVHFFHLN